MSGYTDKPLFMKLGIQEKDNVLVLNESKESIPDYLAEIFNKLDLKSDKTQEYNFVHLFHDDIEQMKKSIKSTIKNLKQNGMIWISWPKKSSKMITNISENDIREYAISIGLVDVKVCSVTNELWSGLKLVIRKENRIQ